LVVGASSADEQLIVDQWRRAGPALAAQRREELRRLTAAEALDAAAAILEFLAVLPPAVERECGLVEQQRLFSLAR
jgi:hypothetical protein